MPWGPVVFLAPGVTPHTVEVIVAVARTCPMEERESQLWVPGCPGDGVIPSSLDGWGLSCCQAGPVRNCHGEAHRSPIPGTVCAGP